MRKRKKTKKEVLNPEVERHLPARPVLMPSLDELNRLMERMMEAERRRTRREFAAIITAVLLVCCLVIGGMAWFTRDLTLQLKNERNLSEKSREDMLQLIYSGRLTGPPAQPPDSIESPQAVAPTPEPRVPAPDYAESETSSSSGMTPEETSESASPLRDVINVLAAGSIPMRLPIPPPR